MSAAILILGDEAWLNITNAALGIVAFICVAVVAVAIFHDVAEWVRRRAAAREHFVYDNHTLALPELGLTMADGGEPQHNSDRKGR
jgi:hypothetical protein